MRSANSQRVFAIYPLPHQIDARLPFQTVQDSAFGAGDEHLPVCGENVVHNRVEADLVRVPDEGIRLGSRFEIVIDMMVRPVWLAQRARDERGIIPELVGRCFLQSNQVELAKIPVVCDEVKDTTAFHPDLNVP
jgi:hypothetical protein